VICRTSTLRAEMRRNERREEALIAMLRETNDRLAAAHGHPWLLPPRPVERTEIVDEIAAQYGDLED
jgi:hypothetical protein